MSRAQTNCLTLPHYSPAEEVVLAALILVPDGDLELLADPGEEVQVELLQPPRVQSLVDRLRLVAVVAQPENATFLSRSKTDTTALRYENLAW